MDTDRPARVRCVGAIVHGPDDRLLLILRGQEPGAGQWSIPGGRVEPGESDHEALRREMLEETGLTVEPLHEIGVVERSGPSGQVYEIHDYAARLVSGTLTAGTDAAEARWVAPDDLQALPCVPGLIASLRSWGQLP